MNKTIIEWYEQHGQEVKTLSDALFDNPEIGLHTYKACKNVAEYMRYNGFDVEELYMGDVSAPNCVVAKFGNGKPIIGLLGELDALPKLSNEPVPYCAPIVEEGPGHGCGHHLMGAGPAGSAVAIKEIIEKEKLTGTIIYYGCPAEETLEGKAYMADAGLFNDTDFCMSWHPSNWAAPSPFAGSLQACVNVLYSFHGISAHAAGGPELGRSALDAAELMTTGVNYLREHVTSDVRMHYCYTHAGESPNVVPDFAQLHFFIRGKDMESVEEVRRRVRLCAEGAAIMTETTTEEILLAGSYETLTNYTANDFVYEVFAANDSIHYSDEDEEFAKELYKNIMGKENTTLTLLPTNVVKPERVYFSQPGSTDVGDVSQLVPTVQIYGGGFVTGLPAHHWGMTASTGSNIGYVSEIYAGKMMAETAYQVLLNPEIVKAMKDELVESRKGRPPYKACVPANQ